MTVVSQMVSVQLDTVAKILYNRKMNSFIKLIEKIRQESQNDLQLGKSFENRVFSNGLHYSLDL